MTLSIRSQQRTPLSVLVQASITSVLAVSCGHAAITTCTVNTTADDPGTASATVTTSTNSGTLRDCILAADLLTASTGGPTLPGMTIVFAGGLSGATIALGNDLPMLFNNTTIDASTLAAPVNIDGGSAYRIFFVSGLPPIPASGKPDPDDARPITVTLRSLSLLHGFAKGGDATGYGGGGMGAGGALFINKAASATIRDVSFSNNAVQGGSSSGVGIFNYGGGGMGAGTSNDGGGGLGGASLQNGGAGVGTRGTAGGASGGWGGQGLGQLSNVQGFDSSNFDVDGGSGTGGLGLIGGGGGGLGGGGGFGGGGAYNGIGSTGGNGGFGGGGGGCGGQGGNGGFGGGGGVGHFIGGGTGGFGGGSGGQNFSGIGGAGSGFGGAVFVRSGGSLIVQSTSASASISGGSVAGGTGSANGPAAGSGMFLMTGTPVVFDITGSYTVSDTLVDDSVSTLPGGTGSGEPITKQGTGTLILSSANTYSGTTAVNEGILRVASPGKIDKSATSVAAAGTLTGDGTTGTVDSFGTLAPGISTNPQGTLHVNGALHLQFGALTCFHADGVNAVSDLNITGAATLNGIARIDFSGGPTAGTTYFPLTAGSVSGTFVGYETNMPNLIGHFSYAASQVTFTVDVSDVIFRSSFEKLVSDSPCIAAFAN